MKRNIIKENSAPGVEERMPMDGKDIVLEQACFNRYTLAGKYTKGKVVVDAACADGYGSDFLEAIEYVGLDYHKPSLKKAEKLHGGKNRVYRFADIEKEEIPECDVLILFEIMEHLEDPLAFIKNASKHVKDTIIISVPNNETPGDNQYHKWIFDENSFKEIISGIFQNVEFYQQDDKTIGKDIYPLWIVAIIHL